jgi:sugar-specific transcriptional regulator TrmB
MIDGYDPRPLQALGFSEIESLVYGYLVENSPATGYRVSRGIGKQLPNTYKAIESLADMGAIVIEEGEKKLCQAVPPDEMLRALDSRFQEHRREADLELKTLARPSEYGGVFRLRTVDQVIQRGRAMLDRAREIVLCDLFPGPLEKLRDALVATAARDILVVCRQYGRVEIPGVMTQPLSEADPALEAWLGQQISIVVDAEEHLIGLLSEDMRSVHEAVWSDSTFLSCMHHNHLAAEIQIMKQVAHDPEYEGDTGEILDRITVLQFKPPGLDSLRKRFHARKDESE